MKKIVVLDAFPSAGNDLDYNALNTLGQTTCYQRTASGQIVERIGDAAYVITNKCQLDSAVLQTCPQLKYIGVTATGYNNIDIQTAKQKGIAVTNVAGYSSDSVAQFVFAYLLDSYSKVRLHHNRVAHGAWHSAPDFCFYDDGLRELAQKTIGLVGFGDIAKRVSSIAVAFGMHVLVYTRTVTATLQLTYPTVQFVDFDTLLKQSDVISIHCPLTPQTQHLFDTAQFAQMQRHAVLINTARGMVVSEQALANALNQGLIAAAYTDVLSSEPPDDLNPLFEAKNMTITPHIAWAPQESRRRLIASVCDNLRAYLAGESKNRIV